MPSLRVKECGWPIETENDLGPRAARKPTSLLQLCGAKFASNTNELGSELSPRAGPADTLISALGNTEQPILTSDLLNCDVTDFCCSKPVSDLSCSKSVVNVYVL